MYGKRVLKVAGIFLFVFFVIFFNTCSLGTDLIEAFPPVIQWQQNNTLSVVSVVVPRGTVLEYQWFRSFENNYNGIIIPGATNTNFNVNPSQFSQGPIFIYCMVTANGGKSVLSNIVNCGDGLGL